MGVKIVRESKKIGGQHFWEVKSRLESTFSGSQNFWGTTFLGCQNLLGVNLFGGSKNVGVKI